eukprot:486397_1
MNSNECRSNNDENMGSNTLPIDKSKNNSRPEFIVALQHDPNNPLLYYELACIEFKQHNLRDAEFFITETLRFDPSFPKAWMLYSMICQQQNNPKMTAIIMHTAKAISNDTNVKDNISYSDEIQSFLNEFDETYSNEMKARNKIFDTIMSKSVEMQKIYFRGDHMAFMDAMMKHPEVASSLKFTEICQLRRELKYKCTAHILSLPKVNRVWNVLIETLGQHEKVPLMYEYDTEQKDIKTIKQQRHYVTISRVSSGTVAWVKGGRLPPSTSEYSEFQSTCKLFYGEIKSKIIIQLMKRAMLCINTPESPLKSARPSVIVFDQKVKSVFKEIQVELKQFDVKCHLQGRVMQHHFHGPYDGNILVM